MNQVLRISQLSSSPSKPGLLPVSRTTIWRWVRNKKFPAPIRLSSGVTVWSADDIEQWLEKRFGDPAQRFDREVAVKHKNDPSIR